jgi:hypothetical protein
MGGAVPHREPLHARKVRSAKTAAAASEAAAETEPRMLLSLLEGLEL